MNSISTHYKNCTDKLIQHAKETQDKDELQKIGRALQSLKVPITSEARSQKIHTFIEFGKVLLDRRLPLIAMINIHKYDDLDTIFNIFANEYIDYLMYAYFQATYGSPYDPKIHKLARLNLLMNGDLATKKGFLEFMNDRIDSIPSKFGKVTTEILEKFVDDSACFYGY